MRCRVLLLSLARESSWSVCCRGTALVRKCSQVLSPFLSVHMTEMLNILSAWFTVLAFEQSINISQVERSIVSSNSDGRSSSWRVTLRLFSGNSGSSWKTKHHQALTAQTASCVGLRHTSSDTSLAAFLLPSCTALLVFSSCSHAHCIYLLIQFISIHFMFFALHNNYKMHVSQGYVVWLRCRNYKQLKSLSVYIFL